MAMVVEGCGYSGLGVAEWPEGQRAGLAGVRRSVARGDTGGPHGFRAKETAPG